MCMPFVPKFSSSPVPIFVFEIELKNLGVFWPLLDVCFPTLIEIVGENSNQSLDSFKQRETVNANWGYPKGPKKEVSFWVPKPLGMSLLFGKTILVFSVVRHLKPCSVIFCLWVFLVDFEQRDMGSRCWRTSGGGTSIFRPRNSTW